MTMLSPKPVRVQVNLAGNPDFNPHSLETREKAFQLFKQGKPQPEISELLKIPLATIRRWSSRGKWKQRVTASIPGPGKLCPNLSDTTNPEVTAIADGLTLQEKQERYKEKMATQALRLPAILETMSDEKLLLSAEKIAKLDGTARKALNLEENKPAIVVNVGLLAAALPARPAIVIEDQTIAGELPGETPQVKDAEFTKLENALPEPVQEKVEAS